jgi:putative flippase GtrA
MHHWTDLYYRQPSLLVHATQRSGPLDGNGNECLFLLHPRLEATTGGCSLQVQLCFLPIFDYVSAFRILLTKNYICSVIGICMIFLFDTLTNRICTFKDSQNKVLIYLDTFYDFIRISFFECILHLVVQVIMLTQICYKYKI